MGTLSPSGVKSNIFSLSPSPSFSSLSFSSGKADYRAMIHVSSELLLVYSFCLKLGFPLHSAMLMHCDHQATIFLANDPTFHECTKPIKIDCHAIRHQVLDVFIITPYVVSSHLLEDNLTKGLSTDSYNSISHKRGLSDL